MSYLIALLGGIWPKNKENTVAPCVPAWKVTRISSPLPGVNFYVVSATNKEKNRQ